MRKEIAKKTEFYELAMGGQRTNYSGTYTMQDGREMTWEQAEQYLKQAA